MCKYCSVLIILQNAYLRPKIGFDAAENEPFTIWQHLAKNANFGKFRAPEVVEGILAQGGTGKDIFSSDCPMISVIFCDIYNFAPLVLPAFLLLEIWLF